MDPAAYPHRPEAVELRETHISWVFLAGDSAYKVKKPVVLPFLDYGTLDAPARVLRRGGARSTAASRPSVYRGVVALVPHGPTGSASRPEHDPRAVEYAVVMRRYDESRDARRAASAQRRRERARRSARSAQRSPRFHAASRPSTSDDATGRARRVVEETLATLRGTSGAPRPARIAALRALLPRGARRASAPRACARAQRRAACATATATCAPSTSCWATPIEAVDARRVRPGAARRRRRLRPRVPGHGRRPPRRRPRARARARLPRRRRRPGATSGCSPSCCAVRALVRAKVDLLRAAQLDGAAATSARPRALELARPGRALRVARPAARGRLRRRAGRERQVDGRRGARRGGGRAGALLRPRSASCAPGIDPYERAAPSAYGDTRAAPSTRSSAARAAHAVREQRRRDRRRDVPPRRRRGRLPAASPRRRAARRGSSARRRRRCCSSARAGGPPRVTRRPTPTPPWWRRRSPARAAGSSSPVSRCRSSRP